MTNPQPATSAQSLARQLARDCRTRVSSPPAWDDVVANNAELRLGLGYLQAATSAGLLADELQMASMDQWPADVSAALAHLNLFERYSPTTLQGVMAHLTDPRIGGLVNTVKGATLELHVVDSINDGDPLGLPGHPDRAALAPSLNQPGWDVETFKDGHHVGYLQMKQTANPALVAEHLQRYPDYPEVATSHEAVASAHARGMDTAHWHGVTSDAAVSDHVHDTLQHLTMAHAAHEMIPEFALAAILVSGVLRLRAGHPPAETGRWVTEQAATAGLSNLGGLAVQVTTGAVVLRPVAAIGTRFTIARVRTGQAAVKHLKTVRNRLAGMRAVATHRGYRGWSPEVPATPS